MERQTKLVNKIKRLLRRAGLPRWLHSFGPKKYEFWHHALALLVKQECRLGYRRVTRLLRWLDIKCPCPSALCTSLHRISLQLWQKLLKCTAGCSTYIVALDGTGLSRPLPSPYYIRRIDKPYPVEVPLKLSIAVDTRTKKILALRLRAKKAHDIKDAKYLISKISYKPKKIVADKAYDAEWLHQYCHLKGIQACIPLKNNKPSIHNMWSLRRQAQKTFNKKTYGRRELAESTFSAIKRKYGPSVSSIKISAQRAETYCRAITHNIIFYVLSDFLNAAPRYHKIYISLNLFVDVSYGNQ